MKSKKRLSRDRILYNLVHISSKLEEIHREIVDESRVMQEELEDRLSKNLTGEQAIAHYNDWMSKNGMSYLTLK